MAEAAPQTDKSIQPVIRRTAPTQEQLQYVSTLRALGIRPNNPRQQAAQQASGLSWQDFTSKVPDAKRLSGESQYAAEADGLRRLAQVTGYKGAYSDPTTFQIENANEGGTFTETVNGIKINQDFAKHLGNYTFKPVQYERPRVEVYDSAGKLLGPVNYGSPADNWFDKIAQIAIPMVITGGFGGAAAGALGLQGAAAAAASGAIGGGLNTAVQGGKFSDVLKSMATGGLGGGLTGGLTSAGLNPMAARAISSVATGAISGRDPMQSLLSSVIGGVDVGNPVLNAFVRAVLTGATAKKGKP